METETIDRLFLELSQFTRATTGKELALANQLAEAKAEIERLREALLDAVGFVSRADSLFLRKATTDTLKGIPDGYR